MRPLFFFLIFVSTFAWGIPEHDFPAAWSEKAIPAFQKLRRGHLSHANFFYKASPINQKSLVILPGRTEPAMKYAELIYDLRLEGFNLFILDHRGQGTSPRALKDSEKGHVEHFQDYVDDLEAFMETVVIPKSGEHPIYLLAHSMGGAIGTHYMARHPEHFKKAVLTAPMMKINTAPYSETVARLYASFLMKLGKGTSYAPGWGPYQPELDVFETNIVTGSEARFGYYKELFGNYDLVTWGPTVRWVHESLKATRHIHELGSKIQTPILLLQAGNDLVVKLSRQTSFCERANCQLVTFPDSKHEILMERDEIRDQALELILGFFENSPKHPKK